MPLSDIHPGWRFFLVLLGIAACTAATVIYVNPPRRTTTISEAMRTTAQAQPEDTSDAEDESVDSEPPSVTFTTKDTTDTRSSDPIALCTAMWATGALLVFVGANGLRLTSIDKDGAKFVVPTRTDIEQDIQDADPIQRRTKESPADRPSAQPGSDPDAEPDPDTTSQETTDQHTDPDAEPEEDLDDEPGTISGRTIKRIKLPNGLSAHVVRPEDIPPRIIASIDLDEPETFVGFGDVRYGFYTRQGDKLSWYVKTSDGQTRRLDYRQRPPSGGGVTPLSAMTRRRSRADHSK